MTPPLTSTNAVARDGTREKGKARIRNDQDALPGMVEPTMKKIACQPVPPRAVRIGETACFQACPRCRRHVLIALVDGLLIRADPENLTVVGELAVLLGKRLTFDVHVYGLPQRMHLEHRHYTRIKAARKYPVVGQHECGAEIFTGPADRTLVDIVIPYRKGPVPDEPAF